MDAYRHAPSSSSTLHDACKNLAGRVRHGGSTSDLTEAIYDLAQLLAPGPSFSTSDANWKAIVAMATQLQNHERPNDADLTELLDDAERLAQLIVTFDAHLKELSRG